MSIKQFHIYLANLNPQRGTEVGKVRPVVVVQTNLLNGQHPSTVVCPITTNVLPELDVLRVHLPKKSLGLVERSDILVDQIRSVDNRRLIQEVGKLGVKQKEELRNRLHLLLFDAIDEELVRV